MKSLQKDFVFLDYFQGQLVSSEKKFPCKILEEPRSLFAENKYKTELLEFMCVKILVEGEAEPREVSITRLESFSRRAPKMKKMVLSGKPKARKIPSKVVYFTKKVAQIDIKTKKVIEIFPSAKSAAEKLNVNESTLRKAAVREMKKTCRGYYWKYVNEKKARQR